MHLTTFAEWEISICHHIIILLLNTMRNVIWKFNWCSGSKRVQYAYGVRRILYLYAIYMKQFIDSFATIYVRRVKWHTVIDWIIIIWNCRNEADALSKWSTTSFAHCTINISLNWMHKIKFKRIQLWNSTLNVSLHWPIGMSRTWWSWIITVIDYIWLWILFVFFPPDWTFKKNSNV